MSTWRGIFTYVQFTQRYSATNNTCRYNKYAQITAQAVRQSLKETERLAAEKRGVTALRYQKWENGVGGAHVRPVSLWSALASHCPTGVP